MSLIPSQFPVTCNTKHITKGGTFVAIKGFKEDGSIYIPQAIENGATTIIVDKTYKPTNIPAHIKVIFVDDTRQALASYAAQALDNPAQKLKFIGITGTAGKTTTTYLVDDILTKAGFKTALMGSIKNKIDTIEEASSLTTPESDYIQMFLAECVKHHIDYVVMEVSSHSIALSRIYGIEFDAVGFTNLSPEHMDFHPTMEDYFQTKIKLFAQLKNNGAAIINTDDSWGNKAINYFTTNSLPQTVVPFGKQTCKDIHSPALFGEYNKYNMCMAYLICCSLGVKQETVKNALASFTGVPGRLQVHTLKNGAKAFVDYAHKPGAFEEVLKTLRPLSPHLIVVFGCGGDRDTTKRPVMGKLAADYADLVIITDDNPRNEDRQKIANEIMAGINPRRSPLGNPLGNNSERPQVIIELDRKKAIALAAEKSQPNSIIAILGKGHENYYLIKGEKFHLDDLEEIRNF